MFNIMKEEDQIFRFPLSREGLEWFGSVESMKVAFGQQFRKLYGRNKNIKSFNVHVKFGNSLSPLAKQFKSKFNRQIVSIWRIKCDICSNTIIYCQFQGLSGYWLARISFYHIHTNNREKYIQFLGQRANFSQFVGSIFEQGGQIQKVDENQKDTHLINFLQSLPHGIKNKTKFLIMNSNYGIDEDYFDKLLKRSIQNIQITFRELVEKFKKKEYSYSILPVDLLENKESKRKNKKNGNFFHIEEINDSENPQLPNILIVVTPQMKEQYKLFGAFVGFDLTFSVIRERSSRDCEYMIGVFAGTNGSKRIVIFGLIITNSQSVFAYKFIFKEFFRLIEGQPSVVVTDQEMAMHHALSQLQKQGIFHGKHLFDMFHILRKYRRGSSQRKTFQTFRKLIHTKDKQQYRHIFRKAMKNIADDKELQLLRNFDLNSEYFCYSQIDAVFVGIGISNSPNQYFHHCIKNNITHAAKYTKAVQMILQIIEKRQEIIKTPVLIFTPYHKIFNLRFMQPLKNVISGKAYVYIVKELRKNPDQVILSSREESKRNLKRKVEYGNNDYCYVEDGNGIYFVYRQQKTSRSHLKEHSKWKCLCELQDKTGYLCSHIGKVLIANNQDFDENIIDRWRVNLMPMISPSRQFLSMRMNKRIIKKIYLDPNNGKLSEMSTGKDEEVRQDKTSHETQNYRHSVKKEGPKNWELRYWSKQKQRKYLDYLINHKQTLIGTHNNEKTNLFFKKMSKLVGDKSEQQCYFLHQYFIKKLKTIDIIIQKLSEFLEIEKMPDGKDVMKIEKGISRQTLREPCRNTGALDRLNQIKRSKHEDYSLLQQPDFLKYFNNL